MSKAPLPELVLPHLTGLYRWCLKECRDPHLAADVVQETALQALRRLPTLRNPCSAGPFLFRIAQRKLVDHYRRRRGELPLRDDIVADDAAGSASDRAARRSCESAAVQRLHTAIGELPSHLRRPVRMHYLQGQPLREVARHLHTSVGNVKTRLYRARVKLRETTEPC